MTWIEQAKARCEAATDGPWGADGVLITEPTGDGIGGEMYNAPDTRFVVGARTDLPFALEMLTEAAEILRENSRGKSLCWSLTDAWLERLEQGPEVKG